MDLIDKYLGIQEMTIPVWVSDDKKIKIAKQLYAGGKETFIIEKLFKGSGKFHKKEFKTLQKAKDFAKKQDWYKE